MQITKPCEITPYYVDEHFPSKSRKLKLYALDVRGTKCFGDSPEAVNPVEAAKGQYEALLQYGPKVADLYKSKFLPLSADVTRMNAELQKQYAPGINKVGQDIALSNAQRQAEFDARQSALGGTGAKAASNALALQRQADPEYFKTREGTSNLIARLQEMVSGIPQQQLLSEEGSGMNGSEMAALERNLARYNGGQGNAPGMGGAVTNLSNALAFGEAGHNRLMANRAENRATQAFRPTLLSQAIQSSAGAIPTFRSGLDAYKIATGKSSAMQYGDKDFANTGINTGMNVGQNTQNNYGQFTSNYQNNTMQQGGILDSVLKGTGAFKNIFGS